MNDNQTDKNISLNDASQVLGYAFNRVDNSLTVAPFLVGAVGRKIEASYPDSVTEVYTYKEGSDTLYSIRVVYSSSAKDTLSSVERIS